MVMAVKIFFCYAHEDEALLNKLKTHLRPLQRQGLIDVWYDRDIRAGTDWEQQIKAQLNTAQIILLLVSPDFMDSDYCYGIEMQRALERHKRGEARVIPVIIRPVYWQGVLGKLQALPTDAKPIMSSSWLYPDEAFVEVIQGIRNIVESPSSAVPILPSKPELTDTGVYEQTLVSPADSDVEIMNSYFSPGVRTRPHIHEQDQVLHIIEGEGIVAMETKKYRVSAGDVITVPAGSWHWHGATHTSAMSHM